MSFVFISYSRRDQEKVDRLAAYLASEQISYWIDRQGISGGDEWRRQIVEGIQNCAVFLLVLSKNSVASRNVRKEIDLAEHYGKRIIPIELEPVEIPDHLEYQLIGIQRIDLTGNMASKMGLLNLVLQQYRQPISQGNLDVTASQGTPSTTPAPQLKNTPRRIEPTQSLWKRMGALGVLYFIAGLLYIGILSLSGSTDGLELALIIIAIFLAPGLIVGYLVPAVRPYLKGILVILGSVLGIILLGIGILEIFGHVNGVGEFFIFVSLSVAYISIPYAWQRSGRPPIWRRILGVAGIYGLAGLLFAVGWSLMFITVIFIKGGGINNFRFIYSAAPNYLFLFGNDFRYGIRPAELAIIYPITWLVPGVVAGWLLPAIRPHVKGLALWLGTIIVIGLIGELIFLTIFYKQLFVYLSPSMFFWRGCLNLIVLVGGPISTLFYVWKIYRKRMGR